MVTPLTVTPGWLRAYREALGRRCTVDQAKEAANEVLDITGKAFARCRIASGPLTVPVEGGASVLKRRGADPMLSEHGKWRREHLGAWNATYSRTPFFIHLMPEIEAVYASSQGITLEQFNTRLLDVALSWLDFDALPSRPSEHSQSSHSSQVSQASQISQVSHSTLRSISAEYSRFIKEDLSIFDLLFRLGPATLLIFAG